MPGTSPTGRDLFDRLCEVLGAETEADLAHALGTNERDVQRLKKGFGANQQKLVDLFWIAGWLAPRSRISISEARERALLYNQARRLEKKNRVRRHSGSGEPPAAGQIARLPKTLPDG